MRKDKGMELFLMRHADAVDGAGNDYARVLSPRGRKQAEKMGDWLKSMGVVSLGIVASPYPRALETADIVASRLGEGTTARQDERLASGMTADTGAAVIHEFGQMHPRLCLVGHSPDLDRFAAHLIGAKETAVEMRKGAIAAFATARAGFGGSTLLWLINPKM